MSHKSPKIERVAARHILDSRGRPTIEVEVELESGTLGRACAPSGASTGRHEAIELRDGDPTRFGGLGVSKAVANVRDEIAPALKALDVHAQVTIDERMIELDGSPDLGRLGGNAVIATSLAVCRAAAAYDCVALHDYINGMVGGRAMTLPMPMTNILSGGAHAGRGMDIQDFLAVPVGATSYSDALIMVNDVRNAASQLSVAAGLPVLLADEGGLSPGFADPRAALDLMVEAFSVAGYDAGTEMAIALDVAASEFHEAGRYHLRRQGVTLSGEEMIDFIVGLAHDYPIVSIEDPLDEDDWAHWPRLTEKLSHRQLLGDDLFVTNATRIARGVAEKAANAALIKVNQNGTLTGTLKAMQAAWDAGYSTIVSARSGETDDSFIADLAVGTGGGQIKIGSTRNSERLSKYNQLLRIEADTGLPFAGAVALAGDTKTPVFATNS